MRDASVKTGSRLHRVVYRASGGIVGRRMVGNDILLLTTTGRRTGTPHTVPLLYLRDGDNLVVVASYGGRDRHPEWYLNLVDHPLLTVQVGTNRRRMRARTATSEERDEWWPRVVGAYADYATYQSRTNREIPLVMLGPVPGP